MPQGQELTNLVVQLSGMAEHRPGGECSNFRAYYNLEPGAEPVLYVTGQCTFRTTGYRVELRRAEPQGINPKILILEKLVTPPSGFTAPAIWTLDVRYEEQTRTRYSQVHIVPDDVLVNVKTVH